MNCNLMCFFAWFGCGDCLDQRRVRPVESGVIKSQIFPGLWLDSSALLNRRAAEVIARLQEGLKSPEHDEFVLALKRKLQP